MCISESACAYATCTFLFRLKKNALNSSLPLLHLFINSVLIQVQVNINEKVLHPDSCDYTLLSSIPVRLNLVRKLLIALEVAGRINSHYFSLQIVIMCYTILVPLIQVFAVTEFVTEVRLYYDLKCHNLKCHNCFCLGSSSVSCSVAGIT